MKQTPFELVRLKFKEAELFLLWESRQEESDRYLTFPGSTNLIAVKEKVEIRQIASALGVLLADDSNITEFDLYDFWRVVGQLRPLRGVSAAHCSLLLDTWNLFEDIARSIGLSSRLPPSEKRSHQHVYKKLFYGNNLPSVASVGEHYSPCFSSMELKTMRCWFRGAWKDIAHICPSLAPLAPGHASGNMPRRKG